MRNIVLNLLRCVWITAFGLAVASPAEAQVLSDDRELKLPDPYSRIVVIRTGRDREIDDRLYRQIVEEIEKVAGQGPMALVLEIDSPGGRVDSARAIVDFIRSFRETDEPRIFAYVPRTALSAAAWIAFACRGLLIAPDATIGDIQPIVGGYTGFERAPEKIITALSEEIVQTSRSNGLERRYPRLFLEAMVDIDVEIVAVWNDRLGGPAEYMREDEYAARTERQRSGLRMQAIGLPGKALTTSGSDILDFGFPVKIARDRGTVIDSLGTPDVDYVERELRVRAPFGLSVDWTLILVPLGVILLLLELKAPGLGLFGVAGVACFVIFFLTQAGWTDAAVWPIVLFLVGAFLILLEAIILPGLIIPGVVGFLLVLYSTYIGMAHPGMESPPLLPDLSDPEQKRGVLTWASVMSGSVMGGLALSALLGKFLHRIPLLGRLVLRPPTTLEPPEASGRTDAAVTSAGMTSVSLGDRGEAVTDLRPSGTAVIAGRRIDVVTRGGYVKNGDTVEVCEVSGNRVVVKPASGELSTS